MLTGDENIVDVDFSVLWKVKPNHVSDFLFNVQAPEATVKAVGESAMRAVIGRSNIQGILTGARQTIETAVQELMQKTLDDYGAGVVVQQVQLQKGRSADAGDRRLPRRAGGAFRSRARPERSPDLRQPHRAGSARPRRQDHPGRRSLSRTDGRRSEGPSFTLLAKSTSNTTRRPTSRGSGSISRPWSGCSAAPTKPSSTPAAQPSPGGGALSAADQPAARGPTTAGAGGN